MKDKRTLWLSGILVGLLALTAFAAPALYVANPAGRGNTLDLGDIRTQAAEDATPSIDDQAREGSLWKIDPILRDAIASGSKVVKVIVVTNDVGALARAVQPYDYRGLVGTKAGPSVHAIPVELEMPAAALPQIASLASVRGVYASIDAVIDQIPKDKWASLEFAREEARPWTLEEAKGLYTGELAGLKDFGPFPGVQEFDPGAEIDAFSTTEFFMDAPAAWANGYTGDGVFVSIIDTGIDFAHPDLQGTQALFNISNVPAEILAEKPYLTAYDGWPIAFDPISLGEFLEGEGDLLDPDVVDGFFGYVPTPTKLQVNASGNFVNFTKDSPLPTDVVFNDQPIFQDDIGFSFPDIFLQPNLYRKPFQVPEGTVLLGIEVAMQATAADVDAALFYDANADGDIDISELLLWEETSTGANPEVFPIVRSPQTENDYILVVLGYSTDDPGLVDITITFVSIESQVVPYDVTGIVSLSGDYHLGLYPDSQLEQAYFVAPAVLVVDSAASGRYDTVYVDLDNDFDFTDEKSATVGDEILFTDVNGDGLADISGGMVYFISNATAVPEYTVVTALGGETFALLADQNISVPKRITVFLNGTVWQDTTVSDLLLITANGGETGIQLDDANLIKDSLVLNGTEIEITDERPLTIKNVALDTGFAVSNGGLLNITVFRNRLTDLDADGEEDWFGPTRVKLSSPADYTVDLANGTVTFTPKTLTSANPLEVNMVGDEFQAFYNFTGVMDPVTTYSVDEPAGRISLNYPLKAGATITADYGYYNWVLDHVEGNLTFTHALGAGDVIRTAYEYGWVPIPGSDSYVERLGLDNFYAGNGDLVAFMSSFGGDHGTLVTSQVVSQGVALFGRSRGAAPDAKIIAIGAGVGTAIFTQDSMMGAFFGAEGYDGVPGTGDEANIISTSFGIPAATAQQFGIVTGFDFRDRFWDWIATNYSMGQTSITVSVGNAGPAYGSLGSANAPGLIMVGGAENFFYRVVPERLSQSFDNGPHPMGGDVSDLASRGPTATGQFGTDVIGAAEFVQASIPLNQYPIAVPVGPGGFNGHYAVEIVRGTSFSAPAAAGILALAYDAYWQRTGAFPDVHTVKGILMAGATDVDNDVLTQGAGYINGLGATNIAGGLGGAYAMPYSWIPGTYRGDRYEVSARLMDPGSSETQMFTLTNANGSAVDYDIAGEALTKFGELNYSYNPSDDLQPHPIYVSGSLMYVLNGTGIWDLETDTMVQPINTTWWNTADLLRITQALPLPAPPFVLEAHRYTEVLINEDWRGHTSEAKAVGFSPDGSLMASTGADGRIFVVDVSTGEIVWEFLHPGEVFVTSGYNTFDVKFAPNSTWLAASLGGTNISIWDVSTGTLVDVLTAPAGVYGIDLSPNGTWMVAGQADANVTVWDITTGTMISIWNQTFVGPVNDVAFSPNGTWVASLDYGWWEVDVWNVTTLVQEVQFDVDPTFTLGFPNAVEFNPTNGQELAFATKYGWYLRSLGFPAGPPGPGFPDVAIYDLAAGSFNLDGYTRWWAGHGDVVTDISWSADGSKIASSSGLRPDLGGDDDSVKIWDAAQNDTMLENIPRFLDFVKKVDFAPDGISFAAADDEGAVLIVDPADSSPSVKSTITHALVDGFDKGIWYERNRQATSFAIDGVEAVWIHDPATRDPDGIIIWNRDLAGSPDTTVTTVIEFYQKTAWPWLSLDAATVTVPANSTATFNATMNVPADAAVGTYEAAIYLRNATLGDVVVPVMVNVPAKGPLFEFGGNLLTSDLYDNNRVGDGTAAAQDRRFYFFDVEDSFVLRDGMRLLVDVNMSFTNTNGNIRHYQQAGRPAEESLAGVDVEIGPAARYGPFILEETEVNLPGIFKKTVDFQGAGNGLMKGLSVGPGLNLLEVQGGPLDGTAAFETLAGRTGLAQLTPASLNVFTQDLDANATVLFSSTLPLAPNPDPFNQFYGQPLAPVVISDSLVTELVDIRIEDDGEPLGGEGFDEYLARSLNTVVWDVDETVVIVSWNLRGQAFCCPDMDLGVFLDRNLDGIAQDPEEFIARDADADADETVRLLLPEPGRYLIKMAGFDVLPVGSLADMTITELKASLTPPLTLQKLPSDIPADEPVSFEVAWTFAEDLADGPQDVPVFLSPGQAPLAFAMSLPVVITIDRAAPTIADLAPAPGASIVDTRPNILATFSDTGQFNRSFFSILLDGVNITGLADVVVPFADGGYFSGLVTFRPTMDLAEGPHTLSIKVKDLAGNVATTSWTFTVDTTGPSLILTSPPADLATTSSSLTVSGLTEPGAAVTVGVQSVSVDAQGAFSTVVTLSPGVNAVEVRATDPLGNSVTVTRIVTLDTAAPVISQVTSTAGLLTNQDSTTIRGAVDEAVSVTVGGIPTNVRADGTFELSMTLAEGSNAISIVATDLAGNQATRTLTVIRDTVLPVLALDALPSESGSATITVSGTVESGINFVTVNGQPVPVSAGAFSTDVALSFGSNEIFVEATDGAGNTKAVVAAVSYVPSGVTVASVGLILLPILAVVALLLGLMLGGMRRGRRPPVEQVAPPQEGEP